MAWIITFKTRAGMVDTTAAIFQHEFEALEMLENMDGIMRQSARLWKASEQEYVVKATLRPAVVAQP